MGAGEVSRERPWSIDDVGSGSLSFGAGDAAIFGGGTGLAWGASDRRGRAAQCALRSACNGERLGKPEPHLWVAFWWKVLRGHWEVENRSFYVLDTAWREDAQGARAIGQGLHILRVWAMQILRAWGFSSIVRGQRVADAFAHAMVTWLATGVLSPNFV